VAEQVRSFPGGIDASAYQRAPDDRGNCVVVLKTTKGRSAPKENPATGAAWPARAQVDHDGFTDIDWQRQVCPTSTLAPDGDSAAVPIDVVQIQRNDLAGSQSQASEQQ
jgi:hypothetical protein